LGASYRAAASRPFAPARVGLQRAAGDGSDRRRFQGCRSRQIPDHIAVPEPRREELGGARSPRVYEPPRRPDAACRTILFDLLNEGDANRLDTWRSLAKSIPQLEAAGQVYFYILGLDGELIPIRPIGPRAAAGAAWLGTFDQELNKAMEKANGARPGGLDREDRAKRTYHQLEVVSNQLAALPGRRDLVWIANIMPAITNSLPCDGDWVDCGTYEIAYAPSAENWDNKFHKIRVTCERKGVKLQVQERYCVLPDSRAPGARQTEILKATYQRPSDAAGIGLGVRMLKKALTD